MGNLEISTIKKNEELKRLALGVDKKYSDDEKTSGNGNEKIDTIFEESALRGKIRAGITDGTLHIDSELDSVMKEIGLKLDKKDNASIQNNQFEVLKNRFNNMHNIMLAEHKDQIKKDGGLDYEKMLKAFKKELKNSGEWKLPGVKDAYKQLEEYAVGKAELTNNLATIQNFQNPEDATPRVVRTRGKRVLGIESSVLFGHKTEDYGNRKYTEDKKAIAENTKTILENIEKSKHLTADQVNDMLTNLGFWRRARSFAKDIFGSKIYDLPNKMKPYLEAHKNADGTYDLSELATYDPRKDNETANGLGYQYGGIIYNASYDEINKHSDPQLNEFGNVKKGLEQMIGAELSDGEVKVLAKNVFGIDTQTRNHSFKSAVKEGVGLPLTEGAAVGFTFGVYAKQKVEIAAKTVAEAQSLATAMGKAASSVKDLGNGKFGIVIEQIADLRALCALGGAFEALGINILANMIFGVEEDEQTCFNILRNLPNSNRTAVEKYVRKELPDKADAVMIAVDRYIQKFNGDEAKAISEFNKDMSVAAGSGSVMNPKECFIQMLMMKPEKTEQKTDGEKFKEEDTKVNTTHEDKEVPSIPNAKQYLWKNLNKIYACFDGMNQLQATRMLQVIQAIDPNKLNVPGQYNVDRITDIVAKAFNSNFKPNSAYINNQLEKEYPEVSKETLKAVYTAGFPGTGDKENKLVTPLALYDTAGNIVCERDLSKLKKEKPEGKGTSTNNVGVKTGYGEDTHTSTTTTHYYIRENGKVREVGKAEYDASPYKVGKRNK